jgi:hypothetical protein
VRRVIEEAEAEKQRQRETRRQERLARFEAKRARKLDDDPAASEPSSVSNSTFTLSEEDTGWLSRQAEMVLEPYFMSFDNTWNRLQARARLQLTAALSLRLLQASAGTRSCA